MKQVLIGMVIGAVLAYGFGFAKGYHEALVSPFHTASQGMANIEKHFAAISTQFEKVGADVHEAVEFVKGHMPHIPHLEDGKDHEEDSELFSDVPVAPSIER